MAAPKRILIVDDEEALTFSLYQSFILSKHEIEVLTASSGEEAWMKIKEQPVDLVLTDIYMPGMSGFDLLERIKNEYPATKVIVMTAYHVSYKKEDALSKGAYIYFEKPFDIKQVRQQVFDLLES
jgi:DNA-binding NtrC family response regulator